MPVTATRTCRGTSAAIKAYTIFNGIFILISDGQTEGTWIPPKLEAAMYRILASLPGVHFDRDHGPGRPNHGMGFYMLPGGWQKQELVINPVTYAYMGFDVAVAIKAHDRASARTGPGGHQEGPGARLGAHCSRSAVVPEGQASCPEQRRLRQASYAAKQALEQLRYWRVMSVVYCR